MPSYSKNISKLDSRYISIIRPHVNIGSVVSCNISKRFLLIEIGINTCDGFYFNIKMYLIIMTVSEKKKQYNSNLINSKMYLLC